MRFLATLRGIAYLCTVQNSSGAEKSPHKAAILCHHIKDIKSNAAPRGSVDNTPKVFPLEA
jgi:hypothetical protein